MSESGQTAAKIKKEMFLPDMPATDRHDGKSSEET